MSYPGVTPQINVGQWNAPLCMCAWTDLRGRTVTMDIIRPDNSVIFGRSTSLGIGNIWRGDQTMLEGQWVFYMIELGDLTIPGIYTTQLNVTPIPPAAQITQAQFAVGPAVPG